MAVYCFTQALQPGKRDEAARVFEEIRGPRREEYEASRRRLGIRHEKVWFQSGPQGEMAVVFWEGDDPQRALQDFAASDDPFDVWLKERGQEIYAFDPGETYARDEEVFEAEIR